MPKAKIDESVNSGRNKRSSVKQLVRQRNLYPCFMASSLDRLARAGFSAGEQVEELLYLGERFISYVAMLLLADYYRSPAKTNELNRLIQANLAQPTIGKWNDLIVRLATAIPLQDLLIDQLGDLFRGPTRWREACEEIVEIRNARAHHAILPNEEQDAQLCDSLAGKIGRLLNQEFLTDFELRSGTASLHGVHPSFAHVSPAPVCIVNPASPEDDRERRSLHPFIVLRSEALQHDERKGDYTPTILDSNRVFLFNGYNEVKDKTLIKLSPAEPGIDRPLWLWEDVPSPWGMLQAMRQLSPSVVFLGQVCKVVVTITNLGGHPVVVPGFRDELPAGTEALDQSGTAALRLRSHETQQIVYQVRPVEAHVRSPFPLQVIQFQDEVTGRQLTCPIESDALQILSHAKPHLVVNRRSRGQSLVLVDQPVEIAVDIDNSGSPIEVFSIREELPPYAQLLSGRIEYFGPVVGLGSTHLLSYTIRFLQTGLVRIQANWAREATIPTGPYAPNDVEWNDPFLELTVAPGNPVALGPSDAGLQALARTMRVVQDGQRLRVSVSLAIRNNGDRCARSVEFNEKLPARFAFVGSPRLSVPELPSGKAVVLEYEAEGSGDSDAAWPAAQVTCFDVLDGPVAFPVQADALDEFREPDSIETVGRQRELQQLMSFAERVRQRSPGPEKVVKVALVGDAGIGKSRILRDFLNRIESKKTVVLRAKSQEGQPENYLFSRILSNWVGEPKGGQLSTAQRREWQAKALAERLQKMCRIDENSGTMQILQKIQGNDEKDTNTIQRAFADLLRDLVEVSKSSVVVAVDDLHWLPSTVLKVLDGIFGPLFDCPILFICSSRPALHLNQFLAEFAEDHILRLQPLSADDVAQIINRIAIYPRASLLLRQELANAAQGNPFHLLQSLWHLHESKRLQRAEGEWMLSSALGETNPEDLSAILPGESFLLVQMRVRKELMERGYGKEAELLKRLSMFVSPAREAHLKLLVTNESIGLAPEEFAVSLDRLDSMQFIRISGVNVSFRFDVQREALQKMVAGPAEAQELHGAIARVLLADPGLLRQDARLRDECHQQLLQADLATQVEFREELRAVAHEAASKGDLQIALKSYRTLVGLGASAPREDFADHLEIIEIEGTLGLDDFEVWLKRAEQLLPLLGWKERRRGKERLRSHRILYLLTNGRLKEAAAQVSGWKPLLAPSLHLADLRVRAEAWLESGDAHAADQAGHLADRGLKKARSGGDIEYECCFLDIKSRVYVAKNKNGKAEELVIAIFGLLPKVQNKYLRSHIVTHASLRTFADPRSLQREGFTPDRILEMLDEARRIQHANGDRAGEGETLLNIGTLHEKRGDVPQAWRAFKQAGDLPASASHPFKCTARIRMAQILQTYQGDLPGLEDRASRLRQAVEYLEQVRSVYSESTRPYEYADWVRSLARIYEQIGEPEKGYDCILELDRILGSETAASGYENDLAEATLQLVGKAKCERNWQKALQLLADLTRFEKTAARRNVKLSHCRFRRANLQVGVRIALSQFEEARAELREIASGASDHHNAARLLKWALDRLARIWTRNDDPAAVVMQDYQFVVGLAFRVDTRLADRFYDRAAEVAKTRNDPDLVHEIGLLTISMLGAHNDPGAAFRYSVKLLNDYYQLYQRTGAGKRHLLDALSKFVRFSGNEDEISAWVERVRAVFVLREDHMVLGHLEKIRGDHALSLHEPGAAAERYRAAQDLWLNHCRNEPDLVDALRSLVLGYLNCNQTAPAVELLETMLEISLETADHRSVFDYYRLLSDHSSRLEGATVRRLLARILSFYLVRDQPASRAGFAYCTSKLIADVASETPVERPEASANPDDAEPDDAEADDEPAQAPRHRPQDTPSLRLALYRILLALDFHPANQFHDMSLTFLDSNKERATALLELSAEEGDRSARKGTNRILRSNIANNEAHLAKVYSEYGWYDLAVRSAARSFAYVAANIRYWQETGLSGGLAGTEDLLEFDSDVQVYLGACAAFSDAYRGFAPLGSAQGLMRLMVLELLPLEPYSRLQVLSQHLEGFERDIRSIALYPHHDLSGGSDAARAEVRRRIDAERDSVLEDVRGLQNDVFRRRSELRSVLWRVLRTVDWESHAHLLLRKRRIRDLEGQIAESFIDPSVQPEVRDRVIRALMSWFADNHRPEKIDHWCKYLSEREAS
jgi:tetratricopeptide (TPR) repeat protein